MQTFRPAANIDLDERAAALGTIAIDSGVGEEYELEFPDFEGETFHLHDQDNDVLSLHDARRKTFVAGATRTPSLSSSESPMKGLFGNELDLLAPSQSEIDDSTEIHRGGAVGDGGYASQSGNEPDPFAELNWGGSDPNDFKDYGGGDDYQIPDRPYIDDAFELPRVDNDLETSGIAVNDDNIMPPPTSRAKGRRTWAELVDRGDPHFTRDSILQRDNDPNYFDGPERETAPKDVLGAKKRKLEEKDGLELILAPIMKITPKPLRTLVRQALDEAKFNAHANGDGMLSTSLPQDRSDENAGSQAFRSPEAMRYGDDAMANWDNPMKNYDDDNYGIDRINYDPVPQYEPPKIDDSNHGDDISLPRDSLSIERSASTTGTDDEKLSEIATKTMAHYKRQIAENFPDKNIEDIALTAQREFKPLGSRKNVANAFLALLELRSKDYITLEQEAPYDDITFSFRQKDLPSRTTSSVGA